jgi:fimbrial chaperone protein
MTRLGILLVLALALPRWALAGSFEVNPVGLTLSAAHATGVVTVTNASESLTVVQLQVVAWSQENGEDVYAPTRNLLATPPNNTGAQGLQVLLRIGIPVFVEPALATAPALHWSARRLSATEISVEAVNDGSAHVQIEKLKVSINAQAKPLAERVGGYVLPGTHASWTLKLASPLAAGQSLLLTADTDRSTLHAQLVPDG